MLDIADNLQRALDAVPAETRASADPGLKALIEGVELTERSLLNALEKNGVKKFDPSGEKFDPNFQQAMYEVPDPSVPAGTVVQVVQAGYMIGERVLRPALVAVSKGGAKAARRQRQRAERPDLRAGLSGNRAWSSSSASPRPVGEAKSKVRRSSIQPHFIPLRNPCAALRAFHRFSAAEFRRARRGSAEMPSPTGRAARCR